MGKMSKQDSNESTLKELDRDTKIAALESEVKYWKIRYELLFKWDKNYCGVEQSGSLPGS